MHLKRTIFVKTSDLLVTQRALLSTSAPTTAVAAAAAAASNTYPSPPLKAG